uniref:Uncharacterized protein n=1 Tax=Anguilla anguilla TaxID=7936 RepID=A0A0E9SJR7_ANGAN
MQVRLTGVSKLPSVNECVSEWSGPCDGLAIWPGYMLAFYPVYAGTGSSPP